MRALVVLAIAACGQDTIAVRDHGVADYNHGALVKAVDAFVAAGRTPAAYAELAKTATSLRPGMDKAVGDEAELKLVVLALAPMQQQGDKTIDERADALALTVWPTLLAPRFEADAMLQIKDPKAGQLAPLATEDPHAYLLRLCGGVLAGDCKQVAPELQSDVIEALVIRHATERVRTAVSDCLMCSTDGGWHEAVVAWEELDRQANGKLHDVVLRADPDNWPIAGAAADDDPQLPEAEFTTQGELHVNGHSYGPNQQRIDVLKELRAADTVIALHIHPEMSLVQVRGILIDARKAGCTRIAVVAREGVYPWRRKVYWIADGSGLRANLRPTDSLQLLLHAIDEVAGPGTVARVD